MISRRKVLELGSAVIGGRVLVGSASAQDAWPSGDIKTICPFPAGTGADIVVRFYAKVLQDAVKHRHRREQARRIRQHRDRGDRTLETRWLHGRRPGLVRDRGGSRALQVGAVRPNKDFDQVTTLMRVPWFLIVAADSPFKTVADLTDHLKEQGDKGSYGSVANSASSRASSTSSSSV